MHVQINVNTADDFSEVDRNVLLALAGVKDAVVEPKTAESVPAKPAPTRAPAKPAPKPAPQAEEADETAEEPEAKPEPKPEPKAAPKPAPKAAPKAEEGPTLEDVITFATDLVSKGKQPEVRAALEAVGVKRVSELKGKQLAEFLAQFDA